LPVATLISGGPAVCKVTYPVAGLIAPAVLATAVAAPAPQEKPSPPITPANAAKVRQVGELPRDVHQIVWGPGDGRVSLLGWETPVDVLDIKTLKPVRQIAADRRLIHFAAAADGNTVAWCENGTRVEVRDLKAGTSQTLEVGKHQPSMTFSPDGKLLATGGYGTEAKLWDAASGRLVRSLDAGPIGGLAVVFSPDGKRVAVGNRNAGTSVYEVSTGKLLHALPRQMSQELKFSPDGSALAVAYVDGTVAVWDAASGQLLRSRETGAKEVYTLDWSPSGELLATAGRDGKIVLWDARELEAVQVLDAPEWVIQVRFSPDGTRLLSAGGSAGESKDRKLVIWGVAAGR
jgi:WD40 repeat protein